MQNANYSALIPFFHIAVVNESLWRMKLTPRRALNNLSAASLIRCHANLPIEPDRHYAARTGPVVAQMVVYFYRSPRRECRVVPGRS